MPETFEGLISITNSGGSLTVGLDGNNADIAAGGNGQHGDLILKDGSGNQILWVRGSTGELMMGNNVPGNIRVQIDGKSATIRFMRSGATEPSLRIDGSGGNIWLGGNGADGDLVLFKTSGDNSTLSQATIHMDAQGGNVWAGGNGTDGDLVLFPTGANNINDTSQSTIHLDGQGSRAFFNVNGQRRARIDGSGGNIWLGGNGADGDLVLFKSSGDNSTLSQATIHLDGQSGDIKLQNADCAEDFNVSDPDEIQPGMVMVIEDEGYLRPCERAYDGRVAGIISGGGEYNPGIVLDRHSGMKDRCPVSLMGKAECLVDADVAPIEVGSLLTSSPLRGHAMRATDQQRAFGAVIGKALRSHASGTGRIPVLVSLQ